MSVFSLVIFSLVVNSFRLRFRFRFGFRPQIQRELDTKRAELQSVTSPALSQKATATMYPTIG